MGWNGAHNSFPHITLSSSFPCPDTQAKELMEVITKVIYLSIYLGRFICNLMVFVLSWISFHRTNTIRYISYLSLGYHSLKFLLAVF